jgi:hypothetical protein
VPAHGLTTTRAPNVARSAAAIHTPEPFDRAYTNAISAMFAACVPPEEMKRATASRRIAPSGPLRTTTRPVYEAVSSRSRSSQSGPWLSALVRNLGMPLAWLDRPSQATLNVRSGSLAVCSRKRNAPREVGGSSPPSSIVVRPANAGLLLREARATLGYGSRPTAQTHTSGTRRAGRARGRGHTIAPGDCRRPAGTAGHGARLCSVCPACGHPRPGVRSRRWPATHSRKRSQRKCGRGAALAGRARPFKVIFVPGVPSRAGRSSGS